MKAVCLVFCLLLAFLAPALAADPPGVPITCKLIDTDATAHLLGAPLEPPQFEWIVVCAGFCAPGDTRPYCSFALRNAPDKGHIPALTVGLFLPPTGWRSWPVVLRILAKDGGESIENVPWRNGLALWSYEPYWHDGFLDVFVGHRAHLLIILRNQASNAVALSNARAIAAQAVARLDAATPEELAPPKWK